VAVADKAPALIALVDGCHAALADFTHTLRTPASDALACRERVDVERKGNVAPQGRERGDLVERKRRGGRKELVVRERVQVVVEEHGQEEERRPRGS
jgi:hypothetical protein